MKQFQHPKLNTVFFWAGFLSVLFMVLPYLVLGQDAIFAYHDQLDGEVIAYLLQAKYLFAGEMIPEFLGGVSKTALVPPAPACVLFFLGGNAFFGLVAMQILGSLCGYVGMYLCVKRVGGRAIPAVIAGVLYAYLPFLPVYGLAQYGLPLLLYLMLEAKEGRHTKAALIYGVVYALTSSLVLVGFGVLGVMALWLLWTAWKKCGKAPVLIWGTMVLVYILENVSLITQTLGLAGENTVSHKTEYVLVASSFWEEFKTGLLSGGQHSEDFHKLFLWAVLAVIVWAVVSLVWGKKTKGPEKIKELLRTILVAFAFNVFFAGAAALWNAEIGIFLRSHLSALGAFQLDRLLWMAPCLWYLMLGCTMALAAELWAGTAGNAAEGAGKQKVAKASMLFAAVLSLILVVAVGMTGVKVLLESNLKANIQKLRNPDYAVLSFADYYAIGVYEQVEDFLAESGETDQSAYRVVSLGIDPAAALYHGFYSLDGYSNNYSLSYKHAFRQIIAPELAKSEYLRAYYDEWGNRCYLLSSECPGYYTVEKGGFFFADLSIDTEALKEMGAKYLFSAAYIANAEELGLTLMREEPFSAENSYYQIYVYQLRRE